MALIVTSDLPGCCARTECPSEDAHFCPLTGTKGVKVGMQMRDAPSNERRGRPTEPCVNPNRPRTARSSSFRDGAILFTKHEKNRWHHAIHRLEIQAQSRFTRVLRAHRDLRQRDRIDHFSRPAADED